MPECFGRLFDKNRPICADLRHQVRRRYGWRQVNADLPPEPQGLAELQWRYLPEIADPAGFIASRFAALDNQRVRLLREVREREGAA